ncbi:hypothetical protein [Marinobacter manganoxydans]|uniref:Uncharacterized protein n=1 Tax=Marinobacter manganoxydans MnI7-9 TaxID=1094979 RepID=G6YWB2_9GAMM|nr:hypothetical protein [Marinobacter manganoxydans]EHJ03306.1 hypothetical protein KYE_15858 [Marinobacter manganoxydans MnI7-9]PTB94553.1 hypothetical protein C9974_03970 [Marinobacter sp. B9-2]
MAINGEITERFLGETPAESSFLHLTIVCGALKYCLGRSKGLSFIKLAYIFDKTILLDEGAFSSKVTLLPWNISSIYRTSLIMAEANGFIEINSKSSGEMSINLKGLGFEFISEIEKADAFSKYIRFLKLANIPENRFDFLTIRLSPDVHK